ncbi:MAG: SLOG family protein [Myxococcota bacterium]
MRVAVTGSRHGKPTHADAWALRVALTMLGCTTLLHGGASGYDEWSGRVADRLGIPVEVFSADWSQGRKAGPIRNRRMLATADHLIALPGGDGTKDCTRAAESMGIPVTRIRPRCR